MWFDSTFRLIMVAALLSNATASWWRSRSASALNRRGVAFVNRNLAVVEDRFVPELDGRFRRQQRLLSLVALLAAGAFAVVPLKEDDGLVGVVSVVLVVSAVSVVALAAQSLWEATRPPELGPTDARTARLRRVSLDDLVPPALRRSVWALSTVVAAVTVSGVVRTGPTGAAWWCGVGVGALVVALVSTEVAARRVTRAAEPAGDAAQLYWQDALRADALGDCYRQVFWATCFLAVPVWQSLDGVGADPFGVAPLVGSIALGVFLWGAWAGVATRRTRTPWFRRRLWPTLAAGEVIPPGRQLVP